MEESPIQALEGADNIEEVIAVDPEQHPSLMEALILAHGEPLSVERMGEVTGLSDDVVREALSQLEMKYKNDEFGFELVRVASKYQFRTKGTFASFIRELKSDRPRRLSPPALETLAIIAYRQPIVRSDIEKIRGVDATPTIKTLLERNLVRIIGHQATVGQPALYGTTDEFLKVFGLSSLSELPTLRDLNELERMPSDSDDVIDGDEGDDEGIELNSMSEDGPLEEAVSQPD